MRSGGEVFCEKNFRSPYNRDQTDISTVQLPMKKNAESISGFSRKIAVKKIQNVWVKFD